MMKMTTSQLRKVIRKTILESRTRTIDLAALLKNIGITLPGQISNSMVDLAVLGSEGWEIVSHLPFSGKYRKGYKGYAGKIYQGISRAIDDDDLSCQLDGNKVCTFEINGEQLRFTFGLRPKSDAQKCREEAESLRNFYNVPEDDIMNELIEMGWTKRDARKALK